MLVRATRSRVVSYLAVGVTGIFVGAGGLAFASSGGAVLHACAARGRGTLRLSARCSKRERAVTWNVRGPQGPKGPTGSRGPGGNPGLPGSPAASMMTARTVVVPGEEGYFAASGPSTISGTESDVTVLTPDAATVAENFAVTDLQSTPGDNTRVYVLRVNGSDTALTCSIVDAAHSCSDGTHSVVIPPNSQVSIHRAVLPGTGSGGGADGTAVLAAWRATTP